MYAGEVFRCEAAVDVLTKMSRCEVVCLKLFYMVYCLCRSVLCAFLSIVCRGAGIDASDVGRVSGICMAGRLFEVALAVGAFINVA